MYSSLQACKPLPGWLCSTFSTLVTKHPLRLLLPKRMPSPQDDVILPPVPSDRVSPPRGLEAAPTFTFSPHQIAMPDDPLINPFISNKGGRVTLANAPRSMTLVNDRLDDDTQGYHSPCGLTLDPLPFSTPGPRSVLNHQPRTTCQDPILPPGFEGLGFVPFSTPGPASTLGSTYATAIDSAPHKFDGYASDRIADTPASTNYRNLASPLLTFSRTDPISHSRQISNGSLPTDLCLPPYNAAPSDPSPAYSSDGILDGTYYEDPLTDDSGSEPPADPCFNADFVNIFATPNPGFCAPRPIYFESPTEDPSDSDPLEPGYEIDLDAIDFKWAPFNRSIPEKDDYKLDLDPRTESLHVPYPREECLDLQLNGPDVSGAELLSSMPPTRMPSPSPFRFVPPELATADTSDEMPSRNTQAEIHNPTPETTQAFAPAPGIYISPLRLESDTKLPILVCLRDITPSIS
ncbi:hypothetical protein DXG01_000888 [Tephrocybe rancida]|nr:hypothetical protein DXG01_000888 [Tephrocybe rancida]